MKATSQASPFTGDFVDSTADIMKEIISCGVHRSMFRWQWAKKSKPLECRCICRISWLQPVQPPHGPSALRIGQRANNADRLYMMYFDSKGGAIALLSNYAAAVSETFARALAEFAISHRSRIITTIIVVNNNRNITSDACVTSVFFTLNEFICKQIKYEHDSFARIWPRVWSLENLSKI